MNPASSTLSTGNSCRGMSSFPDSKDQAPAKLRQSITRTAQKVIQRWSRILPPPNHQSKKLDLALKKGNEETGYFPVSSQVRSAFRSRALSGYVLSFKLL